MVSLPLVGYALKAAIRDRVILFLAISLIISCSLSIFLGSTAVIEQDYFALVFAASSVRLAVVFGLVLFVVFYIRRSFEAKDVEFLLSRPISKVQFVLSYTLSFIILALFMTLLQGGCIAVIGGHLFNEGFILWTASIFVENIIMVAVAFFFSMVLSSAATAGLACIGFYTLSRMIGQILGVIDANLSFPGADFLNPVMQAISIVIPRLDLMAQSSWLVYGAGDTIGFSVILIQGIVFSLLLFFATSIDLIRRQF